MIQTMRMAAARSKVSINCNLLAPTFSDIGISSSSFIVRPKQQETHHGEQEYLPPPITQAPDRHTATQVAVGL